jgi:large subunit ribosomal protein L1
VNVKEALAELRKGKERKFEQGVDLIVNLRGIDVKRDNVNAVVTIPHKFKEKKVCGFFTKKSDLVKTILEPDYKKYKDQAALKRLVDSFDYFIAVAPLMPRVASTFGKVLGPVGKMPSPQLGIISPAETEAEIKQTLEKIGNSIKIRMKEASIKVSIGKEKMKDEELEANVKAIYSAIENVLPKKNENVKNVILKFSMSKPVMVEVK